MVKVNNRFEKMEVSQKYYVHGTTNIEQAIDVLLSPPEDAWTNDSYRKAVRAIINESKRRVHNSRIIEEKKEILAHTKVGDLLTPCDKWEGSHPTVCAFYELVNEGYLKLTKVRSKERDSRVCGRYGYHPAYSYRVVYERIK